jgi:hypothetical protein
MPMPRLLEPEILDSLRPGDPAAHGNRRDLRVINGLMGNPAWFVRSLARRVRPGDRLLEVGAGTGELGLALQALGLAVDGLDLWPRPPAWPATRAWHQADLRRFDGYADYDIILANLILHQFSDSELGSLGRRLTGRVRMVLACEPARRRPFAWLMRVLAPLIRANYVTRHDSRVSIAGGFRGNELAGTLGLGGGGWTVRSRETFRGAYRLSALRHPCTSTP